MDDMINHQTTGKLLLALLDAGWTKEELMTLTGLSLLIIERRLKLLE